jgi:flagellar protein FlgJ
MKIQNGISLTPADAETKLQQQKTAMRDAAEMYEGYFLDQMVRAMRSTVPKEDGILKKNFAEDIFSGQLDQQYVENWTKKGGIGLADMIYNQMSERLNGLGKGLPLNKGVLPISPKKEFHGVPASDSIQFKTLPAGKPTQAQYRFEVPNPSGAAFEAQAPMDGKVMESKALTEGWNMVRLDHGQGLQSELTFPGASAQIGLGQEVRAGQRLGLLDSSRPVLAWKLDWS